MPIPSNPGWKFGYVPSPGEWNNTFSGKVDYPAPLSQGGTGGQGAYDGNYNLQQRVEVSTPTQIAAALTAYSLRTDLHAIVVRLPSLADLIPGDWIDLTDSGFNAAANPITVAPAGADTIICNGVASTPLSLVTNGVECRLFATASGWRGVTAQSGGGGSGTYPVISQHEMSDASFDMAGDFGNEIAVTSTVALTADRTLGIARWATLAQENNLPLRPASDAISVTRVDDAPHWLIVSAVDWSTLQNAYAYVPLWGFHPGLACTTITGSPFIGCSDTTDMVLGTTVEGDGIPDGAIVQSIDNKLQFTISNTDMTPALATATGSATLTFGGVTQNFVWTGNGWNTNTGTLELLIGGNVNYTQTGQFVNRPWGAYWGQFNKGSLKPGDATYNSFTVYPAIFPAKTVINWDWPNYSLATGIWGYGHVTYGDYDGATAPPLGFASTGPAPVQHMNTAFFEAPYAYHVPWQSAGIDWDLLTEYYLWATADPTIINTRVIEIAFTPRPSEMGSPNYVIYQPNYLGTWIDKFGVSWYVTGKRGAEVIFEPADPANNTMITGGTIDYKGGAAYLISQGQVDGTEWNHGLAFGVEPHKGSGSLVIDRWEPILANGKVTPVPGVPAAPSAMSLNNLNLDVGYTTPANSLGCVYTTDGATTYAGWDTAVSLHRTRRLRPGATYAVGVAGYNDGLRGASSATVNMTTTFAAVDFTSTSIWESALLNDSTVRNNTTITSSDYTLPGGSTPTGALLQDVAGPTTPVTCDIEWQHTLPDLLVGTYVVSTYYDNIGDNRNFSVTINPSAGVFFGYNVIANAAAYFGIDGVTDGFFGGNFSTANYLFQGLTFDGCEDNWWRVYGQWQVLAPIASGGSATIKMLNRDAVTGIQLETPYVPDGDGQLGFSRFAIQAYDFTTSNATYYGSNLTAGITWVLQHVTSSSVTGWDGTPAEQYLETTGTAISTGIDNASIVLDTAAHDYIVCWDIQPIGRDFFNMSFDSGDFHHNLDVTFQLSTQHTTVTPSGDGTMTCAQSGVVLLAPNHYRIWARVHKPAGVTTLFLFLTCSDSAAVAHTGDPTKGFILQNNTRICQVL